MIRLIITLVVLLILLALMTAISQIGGVALIIAMIVNRVALPSGVSRVTRTIAHAGSFVFIYLILTFGAVPIIASSLGRVRLPIQQSGPLRPATFWTVILNRNYVRPQLHEAVTGIAHRINVKFPGASINYLDANFPFFDGFPLPPHLSHNDGKKIDLSFQYNSAITGRMTNDIPSAIGYGICEQPQADEENMPAYCAQKGYYQYSWLTKLVPQENKKAFVFNKERNAFMVSAFSGNNSIGKIFIEPHLKKRLGLKSAKIVFHGCRAVRHDDHLHVQLR